MIVRTGDLRAIAERLFAHLDETGRGELEITEDFYWVIPKENLYDMSRNPKNLVIVQLIDDWNDLIKIMTGDAPPIGHALVWLSAILRAVGEEDV